MKFPLLFSIAIVFLSIRISAADEPVKTRLDSCIAYYQDGEYQKAVDSIKALIPLISDKRDEAEAYKYIGFSYCMLDMISKAKDFFKVALEKFPQMVIDTLEVPPNITIVFKQTKLETQMEKGELVEKDSMQDNRPVIIALLGVAGVASGIAGGYFLYSGYKAWQSYNNLRAESTQFDLFLNRKRNDFIIGGVAGGFTCLDAAAFLYFILKKPSAKKHRVSLNIQDNKVSLSWLF